MLSITLGLVLLLGFSYAWFTLTLNGTKQNVVRVGKLSLTLTEADAITIENAVPTYMDAALQGTPYHFTIQNDGTTEANYSLYLDNTGEVTTEGYLKWFYYALKKDGKIISIEKLSTIMNSPLQSGVIAPGTSSEYDLYIWCNANLTKPMGKVYQSRLRLEAEQFKNQKLSTLVIQSCTLDSCIRTEEGTNYFQEEYYQTKMKYVWYSGKLWIVTGYDQEGNIKMVTVNPQTMLSWGTTADYSGSHVETWLNEEFLPSLNNYQNLLVTDQVWNYGKVSAINVKPGQEAIVTSPVGLLNSWEVYQGSNLDSYFNSSDRILNFLPGAYLGTPNEQGKIFLSGSNLAFSYGSVLPNDSKMFGVAPAVVLKKDVMVSSGSGTMKDPYRLKDDNYGKHGELLNTRYTGEYVAFGEGINSSYRISEIRGGKVKLIESYSLIETVIEEDSEMINVFDHVRVNEDGDFIHFYPYKAGSGDLLHYFANDKINYPLGYFLNHDFLSPVNGYISMIDKNMILENQAFYTGTVKGGDSYKNAKDSAKQVTVTVGLPIIGEANFVWQKIDIAPIATNQSDSSSIPHISLTNNGTSSLLKQNGEILGEYTGTDNYVAIRPTFYLKNSVKVKSGSGTKMDPYILTME